jgi:hypothetical protein
LSKMSQNDLVWIKILKPWTLKIVKFAFCPSKETFSCLKLWVYWNILKARWEH